MIRPRSKSAPAWLELALRHRQRRLDGQIPELQATLADERRDEEALAAARRDLDVAQGDQRHATSEPGFAVELLHLHRAYSSRLRTHVADAATTAQQSRLASQAARAEAARDLSERDAFQHRLEDLAAVARVDEARLDTRHIDELWLLRNADSNLPLSSLPERLEHAD